MRQHDHRRGQALVEFSLVIPIILVLVVSVAELGLIYGKLNSLGYASREGARTAAALARGDAAACAQDPGGDPTGVDTAVLGAVQRILTSPDSGIDPSKVREVQIFKATDSGAVSGGLLNIWVPGTGPEIDPGPPRTYLSFRLDTLNWPACLRQNSPPYDSVGVTVSYEYEFVTPWAVVVAAITGGDDAKLTLTETTVMALNPTI